MKPISRVHHIQYKWPVPIDALDDNDWRINAGSVGQTDCISLYESFDDEELSIIEYWTLLKDGKYKAFENGDSLFKNLDDFAESFAGNPYVSTEILRLGWLAWEDEIELEKNQKLIEAVGAGYGGEVNAIKARPAVLKFPSNNLAVFRTVYEGRGSISLKNLKTRLHTPSNFIVADALEVARFRYRAK